MPTLLSFVKGRTDYIELCTHTLVLFGVFFVNPVILIFVVHITVFFLKLFTAAFNSQLCALITIPSGRVFQTCLWGLKDHFFHYNS